MAREYAPQRVEPIRKPEAVRRLANLAGDPSSSDLDWNTYRTWLDGLPGGGLNIAHEAVDRHVARGVGSQGGAPLDRP